MNRPRLLLLAALCLGAATATAEESPGGEPAATESAPAAVPRPPGRFLVHVNLGMNAYTYLAPTSAGAPGTHLDPTKRGILVQQLGLGYFVLPNLRLQLTLWAAETLWGTPAGKSSFAMFSVIPWAIYNHGPLFAGTGPVYAFRSYGDSEDDWGIFNAVGASYPLGKGFALSGVVQLPFWFGRRIAFQVTPALILSRRF